MNHSISEAQQRERISTEIVASSDAACARLAGEISALIRRNAAAGRTTVLGLATGSTPVGLYRHLTRLHREQGLSFKKVITFNLDEYYGLPRTHPESYWRFMQEQLFAHVDIPENHIHVPDGTVSRAAVFASCQAYEEAIRAAGGLDLQILGIGRTGHIGFNEPGSSSDSRTRLVTLDGLTRSDAARDFLGEANVPQCAITMGIGTIIEARRIILLAWGEAKAGVIAQAVEQPPAEALPASLLQGHPNITFMVDSAAGSGLTRVRQPWLVGAVEWTPALTRQAVVWLYAQVGKPVLKLLDEDYSEHGMADLLTEQGPAYGLNIRIFNELQHTITGWPGGKPGADDAHRPERAIPFPKQILVLSPEPSDDALGMSGTLRRLVDQGHAVTVAYQTSGNLGVPDEEAAMAAELIMELDGAGGDNPSSVAAFAREVGRQLAAKGAYDGDSPEIRRLKGRLRRSEAKASLRQSGVAAAGVRFMDLPFYENGRYRRFQISGADVAATVALLRVVQPHQIFATGKAADPNSVPAMCFEILGQALSETTSDAWRTENRLWLYRMPDRDWPLSDVDMAVPLSPRELRQKIQAIYHHKSQRSQGPVVDASMREVWQQAEQNNRDLAMAYDRFGLANYEAIEAFQHWHP